MLPFDCATEVQTVVGLSYAGDQIAPQVHKNPSVKSDNPSMVLNAVKPSDSKAVPAITVSIAIGYIVPL